MRVLHDPFTVVLDAAMMRTQWHSPRVAYRSPIGAAPSGNEYTRQVQRQISRKLRKELRKDATEKPANDAVTRVVRALHVSTDAVELTLVAIRRGAKW